MKFAQFAAGLMLGGTILATAAQAEPEKYSLDPSHSQILFNYTHMGFSTTTGMFSGFDGTIQFDQADPANSSVQISFPVTSMITGWDARTDHFMSPDLFDGENPSKKTVEFVSTSIEVTGDDTALITGDLTLNGITKPVVLDAKLNQAGVHPVAQIDWAGFTATTTLLRSDFGVDMFAPLVSDEVQVFISIEAAKGDTAS